MIIRIEHKACTIILKFEREKPRLLKFQQKCCWIDSGLHCSHIRVGSTNLLLKPQFLLSVI